MDEHARTFDEEKPDPVIEQIKEKLAATRWVREAAVRTRKSGHLITGNILVVPRDGEVTAERIERLIEALRDLDWRLRDVTVTPVRSIESAPEGLTVGGQQEADASYSSARAPGGGRTREGQVGRSSTE